MRINNQTVAHVRPGLSRARGAESYLATLEQVCSDDPVMLRRIADQRADLRGEHGPTGSECIAAELVACTLGARRRPELRMDDWSSRNLPGRPPVR